MLRGSITLAYVKLWFWIDLLASFPYSLALDHADYFNVMDKPPADTSSGVIL